MNRHSIFGYRIVTDPCLTDEKVVERSWAERLFSLPWKPLKSHKIISSPANKYLVDHNNQIIFCHPVKYETIKEEIIMAQHPDDKDFIDTDIYTHGGEKL